MLISIIICTYNSAETIRALLETIRNQSFRDFEVLVIDGNSSDQTKEIVSGYFSSIDLKWYSEPDKGIYDAMNKGIHLSKGKWLYFIGSDDHLIDDYVLETVSAYLNENSDLIYGDVFAPDYGGLYGGEFTRERLDSENICHQSIFYHRTLFTKLGLYNLRYPLLADYAFNLKCFFDERIRKKYVPVSVAYYAPAGLSKVRRDENFIADKKKIMFNLEFPVASFSRRIAMIKQIISHKIQGI